MREGRIVASSQDSFAFDYLFGHNYYKNNFDLRSEKKRIIANDVMTQSGSKSIKEELELRNPEFTQLVFDGIYDIMFKVMSDQFGKDVFGELIEHCDPNQLSLIVEKLSMDNQGLIQVSTNKNGYFP